MKQLKKQLGTFWRFNMKLVIIAGGKGTRLGLSDVPKPMVKINGKPILEYQLNLAKYYGINDVYILSGYQANQIFNYFKDGLDFGLNITHIIEPYPLGTAGSVKLLENIIKERFMVFYGDLVLDIDLDNFIKYDSQFNSVSTIFVHPNDHPIDSDLVEINQENQVIAFHSKQVRQELYYRNLVNAAVYILSPKIFDYIQYGMKLDFGIDIFPKLLREGEWIQAYKSAEYVKDMGTPERYNTANQDFQTNKISSFNRRNKRKAIFLDRDGVINKDCDNLISVNEFVLLSDVPQAIKKINASEYLAIVVTNQPMIAKGFITADQLENIHKKMEWLLGQENCYLDDIYYCPHHPKTGFLGEITDLKIECECRKPKPGMLLKAAVNCNIELRESWMIGDRESDIVAGKSAGCTTILIAENSDGNFSSDFVFSKLVDAVNFILEESR